MDEFNIICQYLSLLLCSTDKQLVQEFNTGLKVYRDYLSNARNISWLDFFIRTSDSDRNAESLFVNK